LADSSGARWASAERAALASTVLLGFALRVWRIERAPLWIDEYTTYFFATEPLSRIFSEAYQAETNPPLYYLLQRAWLVFGDSPFAMRLLPVLLSTLCLPALYLLGRDTVGRWQGVVAALLLATTPLHIEHAHNMRTYSLLTLTTLSGGWLLVRLLQAYASRPLDSSPSRSPRALWVGYGLVQIVMLYSHSTAWLFPVLANVLVGYLLLRRQVRLQFLWHWVAVNAAVLLAGLPWLLVMLKQSATVMRTFWVPHTTPGYAYSQLIELVPHSRLARLLLLALVPFGLYLMRKRPFVLALTLVFVVGQPLLMIGASLRQPMLLTRTMLWPTAFMLLPAAVALVSLHVWIRSYGVAFAGAALGLLQVREGLLRWRALSENPNPIPALVAPLERFDAERDLLIVAPSVFAWDLWYATRRIALPRQGLGLTFDDQPTQLHAWLGVREVRRQDVAEALSTERVWLLRETRSWVAEGDPFRGTSAQLGRWGTRLGAWQSDAFELELFARGGGPEARAGEHP
jgi:hypothetical protein